MKYALILTALLTACGADQQQQAADALTAVSTNTVTKEGPAETSAVEESSNIYPSIYLKSKTDLPFCDTEHDGVLAYVKESQSFFTCSSAGWEEVDVRGKDGAQGVAGAVGAQGNAGVSSTTVVTTQANALSAISAATGDRIGTFVRNTPGDGTVDIVLDSGLRVTLGVLTNNIVAGSTLISFTGANCTGEARMSLSSGQFQNVFLNPIGQQNYLKQVGAPKGSFAYASKIVSGACSNSSGTMATSISFETIANIGITLPVPGGISIAN